MRFHVGSRLGLRWLGLLLAGTVALAAARPLRIGVEINAEPLSFLDAQKRPTGFSAELLQEMARHGDFQVEIVEGYWTRILKDFNAGKIDALANVNITDERRGVMDFSISHAYLHGIIYLRPDHSPIRSTADLAGRKLAVLQGSVTYYTATANHGWGATVTAFPGVPQTLQAVATGDCDAALLMLPLAHGADDHGLKSVFLEDITFQFYFAVHKGDAATLARINEALATVRSNGEFDRLWSKWIGPIGPHPIRLVDLQPYLLPIVLVFLVVAAIFGAQRRVVMKLSAHARALRESEERFRSTFDGAGIGMALVDTAGRFMRTNARMQQMLGYTDAELTRLTFMDLTYGEDLAPDHGRYPGLVDDLGDTYQMEKRYVRKDGRTIWGHLTVSIVKDADGKVEYAVAMVEDITEHKRTQDALGLTQERLQAILDHSPALLYLKNLEGRYLLTNRLFDEKHRQAGGSLVGKTMRDLFTPAEAEIRESHDRLVIEKGAPLTVEEQSVEDGVTKTYLSVKFPLRDPSGKIYGIGSVDTDITEYQLLQAQLAQAQKMDAFGQLAGGIAHDFNNILAVLMMQLGMLATEKTLPAPLVSKLRNLELITQKAARLTRQLLTFSRREAVDVQPMDLNKSLVEVFKMLGRILGEHIELRLENPEQPRWINADAGMMEQIIMNLAVNARDAMPDGGRLTVETSAVTFDENSATETRRPGNFVCLKVTDNGTGMNPATLKRIFEPFFTTKEVGKGTGLGLATVYGIVKQHGGWVEVESAVGKGSTFRVYLPAIDPPASTATNPGFAPADGGRERILLVEDDHAVREIAAMCLEHAGYEVVSTENASEALKQWEEHAQRFDLLITDMVMPGRMNGLKLGTALKEMNSNLKVIVISGYSQEAAASRTPFTELGAYLTKPIDRTTLLNTVRKLLDER
jgi:PAS domain S-box-containing protein